MLFSLPNDFVDRYQEIPDSSVFGYGQLGLITFVRTYARWDNERLPVVGTDSTGAPIHARERWVDVCRRVTEGTFSLLFEHVRDNGVQGWNPAKIKEESERFFDNLFWMRFTPPGRGLWAMGTPFVHEREVFEALQNCGAVSTEDIAREGGSIFGIFMERLMVGVGMGADMRGRGKVMVLLPQGVPLHHDIADSRQGWAEAMRMLVDSYLQATNPITFHYDRIRPQGTPIRGFGGVAQGPEPLRRLLEDSRKVLDASVGKRVGTILLADLFNLIGRCVVAGNVRRSAEILLGDYGDSDFINLKNPDVFPERNTYPGGWGAFSNNSIIAPVGMNYADVAQRTLQNGEPGYFWLENARTFGRMNGIFQPDPGSLANPCLEVILEPYELCTLAELHLNRVSSPAMFMDALKSAYLYAKVVTLASERIAHKQTREVMMRNRRIGLSCTGIDQARAAYGDTLLLDMLDHGYYRTGYWDKSWSQWLGVPESIRRTAVKPAGTVSLLSGATAGIHRAFASFYIRNVRIAATSSLVTPLIEAGYKVEPDYADPTGTVVASFPVESAGTFDKPHTMRDQLEWTMKIAEVWADQAVSVTIDAEPGLDLVLSEAQYHLKSASFLPKMEGVYPQMPYIEISQMEYLEMIGNIREIDLSKVLHEDMDMYCEGEACEIPAEALAPM